MKLLYRKSEITFALFWIILYCTMQSVATPLEAWTGIDYSVSALFCALQSAAIFFFIKKNDLFQKYGLCAPCFPARYFLYYLPLLILATRNFWNGFAVNLSPIETACYLICMLFVGFTEEIIFRGFLFKAMAKDGVRSAIIVSSLTFGLGHLLNLVNGSGAALIENLFQVTGAMAIGFLFVIVFYRGGSLWPCIITHSLINMTSAFANEAGMDLSRRLLFQLLLFLISIAYALYLIKTLPQSDNA